MCTENTLDEATHNNLNQFINDFLLPAYADGKLEYIEYSPLLCGFLAYGVDKIFSNQSDMVALRIKNAFMITYPAEYEHDPVGIWTRLLASEAKPPQNLLSATRKWLELTDERILLAPEDRSSETFPDYAQWILFTKFKSLLEELYWQTKSSHQATSDFDRGSESSSGDNCALSSPPKESFPVNIQHPAVDDATNVHTYSKNVVEKDCNTISPTHITELSQRLCNEASQLLAAAEEILESPADYFAFEQFRVPGGEKVLLVNQDPGDVWFIGDLHSDLLALEVAIDYIDQMNPVAKVVFLGDLFDDEIFNSEIMLRVYELVSQQPQRYCFIAGNHDEGLFFSDGVFNSTVAPANFAELLNDHDKHVPYREKLGELTIKFFSNAPRALIFQNGLLATHGGFPLSDLWPELKVPADLGSDPCLQDFVWTRAHLRAPRKIPNRDSKGCQFGFKDFEGFCDHMTNVLNIPVSMMIKGHDHIEERYKFYEKYERNPVLTINTLSRKLGREIFGEFLRKPSISRYISDNLPEVHRLNIPLATVSAVYQQIDHSEAQANEGADIPKSSFWDFFQG